VAGEACPLPDRIGVCRAIPVEEGQVDEVYYEGWPGDAEASCAALGGTWSAAVSLQAPYQYVRIVDLGDADGSVEGTPGVDIDGIELVRGGEVYFATRYEELAFGADPVDGLAANAGLAMGAPQGTCDPSSPDFVSLGGAGGALTVSFGDRQAFGPGDTVRVHECGDDSAESDVTERYEITLAPAVDSPAEEWVVCLVSGSGVSECKVPELGEEPEE
jgi:hypothetical protein